MKLPNHNKSWSKIGPPLRPTPQVAQQLVLQTMSGAAGLLKQSDKSPAELRRMVTSPGGTTAAAIQRFEEGQFQKLVLDAVNAAHKRARELGK